MAADRRDPGAALSRDERTKLVAEIRDAVKVLRSWLPEPQCKIASREYDRAVNYAHAKHRDAVRALKRIEDDVWA